MPATPVALVRDAASGEILTFGRGGSVDFRMPSQSVEVLMSDGLRTVRQMLQR